MRSWPGPTVPDLPGSGLPLRLFDTSAGGVRETAPGEVARMYVCGITPYDATHLGHAATYLAFDLVNRAWRDAGHAVQYVQNVTDVDDPLLERATRDGADWRALAETQTELFRADMTALRVLPPDVYVGAVEAIPQIVAAVQLLKERGATYDVDGDVYFSVQSDPRFGEVAHLDEPTMLARSAERGGDPERPGKKHPLDCLLWLAARDGEPSWESELGPGRPGWHIECTAISLAEQGDQLDLLGGGNDLAFPHHEMGASEGHVLTGTSPYARHYVHAGLVGLDGEKMSKSRGNLVLVSTLLQAGHDPMAIRLALLAHHYRSDWEWTDADLPATQTRLAAWRSAVSRGTAAPAGDVLREVRERMADDLDAPAALRVVDRWAEQPGDDASAPTLVRGTVDALLGIAL